MEEEFKRWTAGARGKLVKAVSAIDSKGITIIKLSGS